MSAASRRTQRRVDAALLVSTSKASKGSAGPCLPEHGFQDVDKQEETGRGVLRMVWVRGTEPPGHRAEGSKQEHVQPRAANGSCQRFWVQGGLGEWA